MKVAVIFIIVAPGLSLQERYRRQSDSCSGEMDESRQSPDYDYEQSPPYRHSTRRHRHKKQTSREKPTSAELEVANDKYIRHSERHSHRRPNLHHRSHKNGYSDNCVCDCMKCEDLQQCCQPVCNNECETPEPEQANQVEQQGLSPGNLVFVPYPYPLVVPPPAPPIMPLIPMAPPTVTSTVASITNISSIPSIPSVPSITTSTAPSISQNALKSTGRKIEESTYKDNYLDLLRSLRHRKDLPFGRDSSVFSMRPVKRYIPEYGVISDHLIDRLISQARNVKDIHSTI